MERLTVSAVFSSRTDPASKNRYPTKIIVIMCSVCKQNVHVTDSMRVQRHNTLEIETITIFIWVSISLMLLFIIFTPFSSSLAKRPRCCSLEPCCRKLVVNPFKKKKKVKKKTNLPGYLTFAFPSSNSSILL